MGIFEDIFSDTSTTPTPTPMTVKQLGLIQILAKENHLSGDDVDDQCQRQFNRGLADLDRREASNLIEYLQGLTLRGANRW